MWKVVTDAGATLEMGVACASIELCRCISADSIFIWWTLILISLALHYLIINLCFVSRSMTLFSIFISGIYPICRVYTWRAFLLSCAVTKNEFMLRLAGWCHHYHGEAPATFHIEIRAGNHYNWSCVFIIIFFFFFLYIVFHQKNRHQIARKHFNYCLQMANGWLNWTTLWRLAHSWEWVLVSVSVPFVFETCDWSSEKPLTAKLHLSWPYRRNRLEIGTLAKLIVVIVFV